MMKSRVAGPECIDGRENNMGIRDFDYQTYTVADALDEEWLEATSTHRGGA